LQISSTHFSFSSSWSASTFAALDRAKVSNNLKAKRNRMKFQESESSVITPGKKLSRKKRYQQVKALWDERVISMTPVTTTTTESSSVSL
jgi:hypothetical protein